MNCGDALTQSRQQQNTIGNTFGTGQANLASCPAQRRDVQELNIEHDDALLVRFL
jgi:hypothetical protein